MGYEAWILITGALVGGMCGLVGCLLILRKLAMISDAISHTVLLGIIGAYVVSHSMSYVYMLIGAAIVGLLTTFFIQLLHSYGVQEDASIGIVFTTLFAIGVILVTVYAENVHLDVDHVLMGEIAFVPWNTVFLPFFGDVPLAVVILSIVLIIDLLLIIIFYKEFKITSFDPNMAMAIGIPVGLLHYLLMTMVSLTAVASFDSVGSILVVAMLIAPGATAYLLTEKFASMLGISVVVGVVASVVGYFAAKLFDVSIAGSMASAAGLCFLLAFLFSPTHGLLTKKLLLNSLKKGRYREQ